MTDLGFIEHDYNWVHPNWPGHIFYGNYLGECIWTCCDMDHSIIEADIRKRIVDRIHYFHGEKIERLKFFDYEEEKCDEQLFVLRYTRDVEGETTSITFFKYLEIRHVEWQHDSFDLIDDDDEDIMAHIPPILLKIHKYKEKLEVARSEYDKRLEFYKKLKE